MNKICSRCEVEKELSEFYKNDRGKYGVRSICKKCTEYKYVKKGRRCNPNFDMKSYQKEYRKVYNEKNKDIIREKRRKNYIDNKDRYLEYSNQYNKRRRMEDPIFKMRGNIRNLIKNSFLRKFTGKSKKTIEILGCDFNTFSEYIYSMFDDNMTWDNYGIYWEIDHIIPISSANTIEELIRLNHYSNLRPLKKEDNRIKGKKIG